MESWSVLPNVHHWKAQCNQIVWGCEDINTVTKQNCLCVCEKRKQQKSRGTKSDHIKPMSAWKNLNKVIYKKKSITIIFYSFFQEQTNVEKIMCQGK